MPRLLSVELSFCVVPSGLGDGVFLNPKTWEREEEHIFSWMYDGGKWMIMVQGHGNFVIIKTSLKPGGLISLRSNSMEVKQLGS